MGTDSLMNLHKWKNYELLLKHYNFFVYKRLGFDVAEDNVDSINYLDAPIIEISSTLVRKNIKENKSNRYLLSDGVRKEIEENNYYK
jgi:nicotinate-nucleotide adenylyltransferase